MKKIIFLTLLGVYLLTNNILAQNAQTPKVLKYGAQSMGKRNDAAMNKWRANRFGQFIHWGLYAIPGGVWKGKTYPYAAEFLKSSAGVSTATWDSLRFQFNPIKFNAKEWAHMAKQMGVKYMTITTKHHEGFSMWPTKYSDFSIAASPGDKNILKELVEAYNAEGIDVNFYYSVLDWHHPDWRYDIKSKDDSVAFARYLDFAKLQLKELATNYPTVKAFWFDGTWDNSVKKNGKWTLEVEQMLKQVSPGVIVNSRLRADDFGARHKDSNGNLMGDYESGYERKLPAAYDNTVTKWDWESCMTIPENQWGYHKDWSLSHVKSSNELIEMLVRSTALGGNFLLNFGPKGDGSFRQEEQTLAKEIGEWMKMNGEAIYGCGYAGLEHQDWGYYTQKQGEEKVYMVVCNTPVSSLLRVKLPAKTTIVSASFIDRPNEKLKLEEIAKNEYFIQIPKATFSKPYVIVVQLNKGPQTEKAKYQDAKI